jgi:hypothetical protein
VQQLAQSRRHLQVNMDDVFAVKPERDPQITG